MFPVFGTHDGLEPLRSRTNRIALKLRRISAARRRHPHCGVSFKRWLRSTRDDLGLEFLDSAKHTPLAVPSPEECRNDAIKFEQQFQRILKTSSNSRGRHGLHLKVGPRNLWLRVDVHPLPGHHVHTTGQRDRTIDLRSSFGVEIAEAERSACAALGLCQVNPKSGKRLDQLRNVLRSRLTSIHWSIASASYYQDVQGMAVKALETLLVL